MELTRLSLGSSLQFNVLKAYPHYLSDLPRAGLSLGPTLNANKIKEGDDVYFECSIDAKPAIYKTSWWFNVSIKYFFTFFSLQHY